MRSIFAALFALVALLSAPAAAQLGLPRLELPRLPVGENVGQVADATVGNIRQIATRLIEQRDLRIARLLRDNRDAVELDRAGNPARKGELLVMDLPGETRALLSAAGFGVIDTQPIEELDIAVTRLSLPLGLSLADAEKLIAELAPGLEWSADHLHFQTGAATLPIAAAASAGAGKTIGTPVGMIDGGTGKGVAVTSSKGFAAGAPMPSNHGTAIASLLNRAGVRTIHVADVYGSDRAGGNALAIARGIGWLSGKGAKVITISLVGPRNALVERAVAAARRKGVVIVAAVGNDGPAAPPAYPASYGGVVAVTAVDKRNRVLIEAGRAAHLDYAAPGADITGTDAKGRRIKLRGTSFATPLAAARIAAARAGSNWREKVDSEAVDLGPRGPDTTYGRGLLCGSCR